jgi:ribonuclease H2 subunit C
LPLPENYTGAVLHVTDKQVPQNRPTEEDAEDDEEDECDKVEVTVAEKVGVFDEVVVWGHGGVVDEKEDAYVRGIREWIGFAEAMHAEEDEESESKKTE